MMTNVPPETPPRVLDYVGERIRRGLGEPNSPAADEPVPIDAGSGGPHPPGMDIGERLARLEAGQDWIKVILGLIGAFVIGGFTFLGVQINRLVSKMDGLATSLGARISAESAQTRQELVGIANAISNSITATKQVQPQVIVVPVPGAPALPKP